MTPEEIALLDRLQATLASLPGLMQMLDSLPSKETLEKVLDRLAWSGSLIASTADRHIVVVDRLEKTATAYDRNTDAQLLVRQRLTEIYEQREFIRAGLDALKGGIDGLNAAISVEKKVEKAIRRGVREATDRHRLMSADELESGGGAVGAVTRFGAKILDAPVSTKIFVAGLVLVAAFAFGGWVMVKLHEGAEAPQGKSITEWRARHPQVSPAPGRW